LPEDRIKSSLLRYFSHGIDDLFHRGAMFNYNCDHLFPDFPADRPD